jgi:signal transduction histidine kinase
MATEDTESVELLSALDSSDWSVVLQAVALAETQIRNSIVGDPKVERIVAKLPPLASHAKWEVQRAVANTAAHTPHAVFEGVLAKLALDDNRRVRQAAEYAALRRRDSRNASTLGKQHEERINSALDRIEARFGAVGRDAVKRTAEQMANTFARELYHEVIKLLSPLAISAERLQTHLSAPNVPAGALLEEATRIGRRVTQLRAVLDGMRAYTAQPTLTFQLEILQEIVDEAASVALESDGGKSHRPSIEIRVPSSIIIEASRSRLVQAFTNILVNAIESYQDVASLKPIEVSASVEEHLVLITIRDAGSGMSAEAQRDALTLFSTSKPNGTGFGLPLALKIVESEHGGRLTIESIKGQGTSVLILIPKHREEVAR